MMYLDNSATSRRKPISVYGSLLRNTLFNSANAGRGSNPKSLKALKTVVAAQEAAAELINADNPLNIAFVPNATLALNMVILGMERRGHIAVTQMDHNSVLRPAFKHGNYSVAAADKTGYVSAAEVERILRPDTRLIVCTHASNVCGTIEPIAEIGALAKSRGILFMADAAQTIGCARVDVKEMNADFLAFSGHKGLMAPLGTGALYVRDENTFNAVITGGTGSRSESLAQPSQMPELLHAGTLNVPAIAAMSEAAKFIMRHGAEAIGEAEREIANKLAEELKNMDGVTVYGREERTGAVAFNIDGIGSAEVAELINPYAAVRSGYHCAPMAHKALGTYETGAVRASFGFYSRKRDAAKFADIVRRAVRTARQGR